MIRVTIEDEGPGFNPEEVPDPTDFENLDKPSGRGIVLMRAFMDEVLYNDRGNQLTFCKRCSINA
jgi:serine/threonine-protein kinase RsbW